MRAVQITRFGGPEVLDVVDIPDPTPGPGQQLYDVSTAGVNYADTHQALSREVAPRRAVTGKLRRSVNAGWAGRRVPGCAHPESGAREAPGRSQRHPGRPG